MRVSVKENNEKKKKQNKIKRTTYKKRKIIFVTLKTKNCWRKEVVRQTIRLKVTPLQQQPMKKILTLILCQRRCLFNQQKNLIHSMRNLHITGVHAANKSSLSWEWKDKCLKQMYINYVLLANIIQKMISSNCNNPCQFGGMMTIAFNFSSLKSWLIYEKAKNLWSALTPPQRTISPQLGMNCGGRAHIGYTDNSAMTPYWIIYRYDYFFWKCDT